MAIYLILMSAGCAALQNFFMRRSVDTTGSTNSYVPVQLFVSMLIVVMLNPIKQHSYTVGVPTVAVGLVMGVFLGVMMFSLGQAIKQGAASLTFGVLNSSSVMPAVVMVWAFGSTFGHPYHWWNGLGSLIVVFGILWSAKSSESSSNKLKWIFYTFLTIGAFVLFSVLMQWRVLLERFGGQGHTFLPFALDPSKAVWFMPAIFFSATLFQLLVMGKAKFTKDTVKFGLLGGVANGCSMFFMVLATETAVGWQNAVLFPVFSIAVIEICNLWGKLIYKEKIHWLPSTVCIIGLIVGAVQWTLFKGG